MIIGQTLLYNSVAYYTSWIPCEGNNGANISVELITKFGSGTLTITVQSKKQEDPDSSVSGTTWGSGALSVAGVITSWKAGQEVGDDSSVGFNDLIRLKIAIGGSTAADGVHFRMLAPQWLG